MISTDFLDNNSVWFMYNAENSDPYFSKFITNKTIVPSVAIVSHKKIFLITHSLDYDNIKDLDGEVIIYSNENSLVQNIEKILKTLGFPENIYLNYSDKLDAITDVLGYGTYRFLHDNISKIYQNAFKTALTLRSADEIIYSLMSKKSEEDIKYLKIAANRALNILSTAFKKIKIGMTEKQIAVLVHNIFKTKPAHFKTYKIIHEEFAWEKEQCPIVLVGPNLSKGGHCAAGNEKLKPGYTIYFDFGVKITLADGQKYSSDIQRMGYALKLGEHRAPEDVQHIFYTLVEAVELGIQNCTPEKKGYEIDEIVRNHIIKNGFPNYNHSTGHPIGELAHSPGTSLSPKGHKRAELYLQENGVYTIEPRIQIKNGGSIEEMVLVTKNGGVPLCTPQKKLYLIN